MPGKCMDTLEAPDPSRSARSDDRGRRPRKCRNVIDVAADECVLDSQDVEEERRPRPKAEAPSRPVLAGEAVLRAMARREVPHRGGRCGRRGRPELVPPQRQRLGGARALAAGRRCSSLAYLEPGTPRFLRRQRAAGLPRQRGSSRLGASRLGPRQHRVRQGVHTFSWHRYVLYQRDVPRATVLIRMKAVGSLRAPGSGLRRLNAQSPERTQVLSDD